MACVTSCPSGVQYDRLIEQTRAHIEENYDRPRGERLQRALVFAVVPHPRRLRMALALTPQAAARAARAVRRAEAAVALGREAAGAVPGRRA